MKILQLDVNRVAYTPLEPEAKVHESAEKHEVVIADALLLLIAIEQGDSSEIIKQASEDVTNFANKQKLKRIVVYPFAHLSQQLDDPDNAVRLLHEFAAIIKSNKFDTSTSPFGWNKKLSIDIKGHPLAEQMRSYGVSHKPAAKKHHKIDTSIVRKSEFSGLPESDHRTIGTKLDLFSFQEVSPGMVYWHPKGHTIYRELVAFAREINTRNGYQEVSNPEIANIALWHASGHMEKYLDDMFLFQAGDESLGIKPMNCPSTILAYKSTAHSYREFPLRLSCFDKLHRNEISGALTGLFRVREMSQDDAHIFLTEEQVEQEITMLLKMVDTVYKTFGLKYTAKLSTMPDKHLGSEELWERATSKLRRALEVNNIKYELKQKDGAFYGPKIDFDVIDSMGRAWQCATIQVDYQQPMRLKAEYTAEDGTQQTPVLVHRAIMGTLERFIGIMIEHFAGKFPVWLSPVQAKVVSISEHSNDYARQVHGQLLEHSIRSELDISDRTLNYKIRDAQMHYVPYIIVVGKKEAEASTLSVRTRDNVEKHGLKQEEFISQLNHTISARSLELPV